MSDTLPLLDAIQSYCLKQWSAALEPQHARSLPDDLWREALRVFRRERLTVTACAGSSPERQRVDLDALEEYRVTFTGHLTAARNVRLYRRGPRRWSQPGELDPVAEAQSLWSVRVTEKSSVRSTALARRRQAAEIKEWMGPIKADPGRPTREIVLTQAMRRFGISQRAALNVWLGLPPKNPPHRPRQNVTK